MKEKKKLLQKHEPSTKEKVHIMNFSEKKTLILWISWSKKGSFSTQKVGRKIFPQYLRNLHVILRTETDDLSVLDIFCSVECHVY